MLRRLAARERVGLGGHVLTLELSRAARAARAWPQGFMHRAFFWRIQLRNVTSAVDSITSGFSRAWSGHLQHVVRGGGWACSSDSWTPSWTVQVHTNAAWHGLRQHKWYACAMASFKASGVAGDASSEQQQQQHCNCGAKPVHNQAKNGASNPQAAEFARFKPAISCCSCTHKWQGLVALAMLISLSDLPLAL